MLGRLLYLSALIGASLAFSCYQCFTNVKGAQNEGKTPDLSTLQQDYAIFGLPMDKMPPYSAECDGTPEKGANITCTTYCLSWYIEIPANNVTRFMRGCYDKLTGVTQPTQGATQALSTINSNKDNEDSIPSCQFAPAKFWSPDGTSLQGHETIQICNKDEPGNQPCNEKNLANPSIQQDCTMIDPNQPADTCYDCRNDNKDGQCDDGTCTNAAYCTKTWTQITQSDGDHDYVTEKGCSQINPHFDNFCTATGTYETNIITRSTSTKYNTSSCYCRSNECNAASSLTQSLIVMASALGLKILY